MSALELEMETPDTFTEKYLMSYCNSTSNQYHRQIANYLKSYIEKELILQTISGRLQKTEGLLNSLKIKLNPKKDTRINDTPDRPPMEEWDSSSIGVVNSMFGG